MKYAPIWCNPKLVLKITVSFGALIIAVGQANAQETANTASANGSAAGRNLQEAPNDDDDKNSDILVTGSNIRGNRDLSTSLTTISRDDFEKGGFLDVSQAINSLPQSFGGGLSLTNNVLAIPADNAAQNVSRATSPNLRGLGSGATLTLLDGGRLPSSGAGLGVDISMIPAVAIERVEVLADGASATYGADAVAGVVNIITRRHLEGVETRALYGSAGDGLGTYRGSVAAGVNIGRFSGVLSGEYQHQDPLSAADRSATSNLPLPYDLTPLQKRASVMGSATLDATDHVRLFVDGLWSLTKIDARDTNRFLTENPRNRNEGYVFSAGVEGDIGSSWHAKLSGRIARNDSDSLVKATYPTGSSVVSDWHRITNLKSVDATVDGKLLELPGGAVKASFGTAFRDENVRSITGTPPTTGRNVVSLFGELSIPLVSPAQSIPFVRSLSISAAGRYDTYSRGLGSAFVPKFAGAWNLGSGFEIRGTYSRSYRVASLYEQTVNYYVYRIPVKDNVPGGISNILLAGGTGGQLGPERSQNIDVQFRYQPEMIKGLSFSLSYYSFRYKNRIANPDPAFKSQTDITNAFPATITRSPSQQQINDLLAGAYYITGGNLSPITAIVDDRLRNISKTNISGFEGQVDYNATVGKSVVGFTGIANYINKFDDYLGPDSAPTSRVGTVFSPSHWRSRAQASWSRGNLAAAAAWNHVGSYEDNRLGSTATVPVDAWNTFDLSFTVHLTGDREHDTRLTLAATNLFDARPPYIAASSTLVAANFDPTNASAIGRFVSIEFVKKW